MEAVKKRIKPKKEEKVGPKQMKKIIFFLLSLFLGICLSVWVYNMVGWEEIKNVFTVFSLKQGLIILVLTLLITLFGAWKWHEVLVGEGVELSFFDTLKSYLSGYPVIFLAPILFLGGEILRVYALREKHNVSWTKGISSIIIDRFLESSINLATILLGLIFFVSKIYLLPLNLIISFSGILLLFIVTLVLFYMKVIRKESVVAFFSKALRKELNGGPQDVEREVFVFFNFKNKALWRTISLSLVRVLIMYARTLLLLVFLKQEIAIWHVLSILGFSFLAATIPIPADAGIHELVQIFAFGPLGLSASSATAFTIIIRVAETTIALIGIFVLSRLGFSLLKHRLLKALDMLTNSMNNKHLS